MYVLRHEPEDGSPPLRFEPWDGTYFDVEPLNHIALSAYTSRGCDLPITLRNARIEGSDAQNPQRCVVTLRLSAVAGEPMYGLVEGGWVPFPFMSGDVAMFDHNVVTRLRREVDHRRRDEQEVPSPYINLSFAGRLVSPLPYVIEGTLRRTQSTAELQSTWEHATSVLREFLPAAQVVRIDEARLRGLHGLLENYVQFLGKAVPFLLQVCPLVAQPVATGHQVGVEREILQLARSRCISLTSPVVLAVLSCLYDNHSSTLHRKIHKPGRAVVKPSLHYSEQDAYAALSDLIFLEMLIVLSGGGIAHRPVLYTHDLGLAAFWSALEPHSFASSGERGATGQMTLSPALLPELSQAQCTSLLGRLQRP